MTGPERIFVTDLNVGDKVFDKAAKKYVVVTMKTVGQGVVTLSFSDLPERSYVVPPYITMDVWRGAEVQPDIVEAPVVTSESYEQLLEDELRIEDENKAWAEDDQSVQDALALSFSSDVEN